MKQVNSGFPDQEAIMEISQKVDKNVWGALNVGAERKQKLNFRIGMN